MKAVTIALVLTALASEARAQDCDMHPDPTACEREKAEREADARDQRRDEIRDEGDCEAGRWVCPCRYGLTEECEQLRRRQRRDRRTVLVALGGGVTLEPGARPAMSVDVAVLLPVPTRLEVYAGIWATASSVDGDTGDRVRRVAALATLTATALRIKRLQFDGGVGVGGQFASGARKLEVRPLLRIARPLSDSVAIAVRASVTALPQRSAQLEALLELAL